MAQLPEHRSYPPVRKRKKLPKWRRMLRKYWPPIRFGLIILILILIIVFTIIGIVRLARPDDGGTKVPNKDPISNQDPDTGKDNGEDNGEDPDPTVPTPPSDDEIKAKADQLMEMADFVAAGYDYTKAISILESFPFYKDFPEMAQKVAEYRSLDSQLVSYSNMSNITHIFFHSLIVDTDRCFDGEYTAAGYNQYMATVDEFNAILEEMYKRGFVLVTPYQVAYEVTDEDGTHFTYGDIRLPAGKEPFIMSQDDLNYYGYMIAGKDGSAGTPIFASTAGDGFAHRMVVGEDGYPTCEYMDANGNVTTGDYDLVPLLEKFIQEHPDFAYHGARAVLGMTGYEGVFGYRTNPIFKDVLGAEAYQKEVDEAKKVAQCLRDHGWVLASHSYGHPAYGAISAERVERDSQKWEDTVQPIIGDCDVILYPHGSDIAGIEYYSFSNPKFAALYEDGYRYFFNVDSSIYWSQMTKSAYRGGRRNIDGYRMYYNPGLLDDLFDVDEIFDKDRPTPVPAI